MTEPQGVPARIDQTPCWPDETPTPTPTSWFRIETAGVDLTWIGS